MSNSEKNNQYLYFYLKQNTFSINETKLIIEKLKEIVFAQNIYFNSRPCRVVKIDERGLTCLNHVTDDEYGRSINNNNISLSGGIWTEI